MSGEWFFFSGASSGVVKEGLAGGLKEGGEL